MTFADTVHQYKQDEAEVIISKNNDYGQSNIGEAPGGPLTGISVRLHDKISRLGNLLDRIDKEPQFEPQYESLDDTLLDAANYATIGRMVIAGHWPTNAKPPTQENELEMLRRENEVLRSQLQGSLKYGPSGLHRPKHTPSEFTRYPHAYTLSLLEEE